MLNVADGATANDTDANLKNRANHTGTQAASTISDFDTEVSNNASVVANTAKTSNVTHTGEVTGSGALTVDKTAVTGKTTATPVSGDFVLFSDTSDSGNLKKADASNFLGGGGSGGALSFVSTQTASASAALEFTSLGTEEHFLFVFEDILLATDAQKLIMEFSNDNGTTWETTSYKYAINGRHESGIGDAQSASAAYILITPLNMGNASGEDGLCGELRLYKPLIDQENQSEL